MSAEDIDLAFAAFGLMSKAEKVQVLTIFASLRFPTPADRFYEAVYRVVRATHDGRLTLKGIGVE